MQNVVAVSIYYNYCYGHAQPYEINAKIFESHKIRKVITFSCVLLLNIKFIEINRSTQFMYLFTHSSFRSRKI